MENEQSAFTKVLFFALRVLVLVIIVLSVLAIMALAAFYFEQYAYYVIAGFLALIAVGLVGSAIYTNRERMIESFNSNWLRGVLNWLGASLADLDAKLASFDFRMWIALAGGLTVILIGITLAFEIHARQFGLIAIVSGAIAYLFFWHKKVGSAWRTRGQLFSILVIGAGFALLDNFSSGLLIALLGITLVTKIWCPELKISITWPAAADEAK